MVLALGIAAVLLCGLGVVWIGQGAGSIHGSPMTGHIQWTYAGVVLLIAGLGLAFVAYRRSNRKP